MASSDCSPLQGVGALETLHVGEAEQNLRFQGQYFDDETYSIFRYYDLEVGRCNAGFDWVGGWVQPVPVQPESCDVGRCAGACRMRTS